MNNMVTNQSLSILTQSSNSPANNVSQKPVAKVDTSTQVSNEAAVQQRQEIAVGNTQQANKDRLDEVVAVLNDFVQQIQRDLNFSVDEDSGRTVVKVLDTETKEVIRQIPSQEVLDRIHHLQDVQGLLFKDQA